MFAGGVYVGGRYIGQGEVVATLCVMGEVAVAGGFLDEPEFLALSEQTGRRIRADYPQLADVITLGDETARRTSAEETACSRVLMALTAGAR